MNAALSCIETLISWGYDVRVEPWNMGNLIYHAAAFKRDTCAPTLANGLGKTADEAIHALFRYLYTQRQLNDRKEQNDENHNQWH